MLNSKKLRDILGQRNMTQKQLAELSGIAPAEICAYLKGRNPSISRIHLIADALEVDVDDISIVIDPEERIAKSLERIDNVAGQLEESQDDDSIKLNALKIDALSDAHAKIYEKISPSKKVKNESNNFALPSRRSRGVSE